MGRHHKVRSNVRSNVLVSANGHGFGFAIRPYGERSAACTATRAAESAFVAPAVQGLLATVLFVAVASKVRGREALLLFRFLTGMPARPLQSHQSSPRSTAWPVSASKGTDACS
jgi:hypothetical protein